ncbi:MAG: hypothetical protein ISS50_06505 [Anaerolineae bacterium]|nr:hypothetical protein [Anaerolineae bacterium]
MSSHRIKPKTQPLDAIDELIRWALLDAVAGEEPSPQVWHNIQARLTARSRAIPGQSGVARPWQQFASTLQAWALGITASLDANWDPKLAPQERSYLIWRATLPLSMMPMATMIIY